MYIFIQFKTVFPLPSSTVILMEQARDGTRWGSGVKLRTSIEFLNGKRPAEQAA